MSPSLRTAPFRPAWAFLVALLLSPASPAQTPLTPAQREENVRQLVDVVRRTYAYVEDKRQSFGVDLDAIQADALKRLGTIKSDAEFHDLLKEMTASLKDGHCEVYAWHLQAPRPRAWPFVLKDVKEGVLVADVDPRLAKEASIRRGDLLREVNGRPIEDWVAAAMRKASASSEGGRRLMALERMTATADERLSAVVERPAVGPVTVSVPTLPHLSRPMARPVDYQRLTPEVGYLRIRRFVPDTKVKEEDEVALKRFRDAINQAFASFAGTKALVLDLRGNGGGRDLLGTHLTSHLLPGGFVYYSTQTRRSPDLKLVPGFGHLSETDGWELKQSWRPHDSTHELHRGKPYPGRVVTIIDEGCFSTTDCVLACLRDLHPDFRTVGRPAQGGSGGPTVIATLPHSRASVQVCVMKVWSPKGRLIEGNGARPDVPIQWTRDDVLSGRDPDFDAALREATR